jgi:hypothetical protein
LNPLFPSYLASQLSACTHQSNPPIELDLVATPTPPKYIQRHHPDQCSSTIVRSVATTYTPGIAYIASQGFFHCISSILIPDHHKLTAANILAFTTTTSPTQILSYHSEKTSGLDHHAAPPFCNRPGSRRSHLEVHFQQLFGISKTPIDAPE